MYIFNIKTEADFINSCIETFHYQYENIEIYKNFVDFLGINTSEVLEIEKIPFLPVEMFKNHKIVDKNLEPDLYFQSSGTTQTNLSKHWICNENIYRNSIIKSFEKFIGNPENFIFLGLLPSYLEKENSSLIYMVDYLMKISNSEDNTYFLYEHEQLHKKISFLEKNKKDYILFGISFALLDFLDTLARLNITNFNISKGIIIETGGMKGRKSEITKDELLVELKEGFGTDKVYSEYSMTELLSQAYSTGNNLYKCPNWMRVLIRNLEDPFSYMKNGQTGAINIIDLANRHSCAFIATQDLGKSFDISAKKSKELKQHEFQVLGRIDNSDIRGCSLLVS